MRTALRRPSGATSEKSPRDTGAEEQIAAFIPDETARPNSNLNDYAHHQFAGLLGCYYLKRWEVFFANPENADAKLDELERSAPSAIWDMPSKDGDVLSVVEGLEASGGPSL